MMKNFSTTKYCTIQTYIEPVYAFVLLITGNRVLAEKITIESFTESYCFNINTINLEQYLHIAYRKSADTRLSRSYEIHDQLTCMLSKLTFIERSLVLLRYRYHLTDKTICKIVRKRQPEVYVMMRNAFEKMMEDSKDGYMHVSECETAEHIHD